MIDQLNVLVQVTQAKSDAIRSGRFSRFSPIARLRLVMLRRALEALALLATLFATPSKAPEAAATNDPIEPVQAATPIAAAPTAFALLVTAGPKLPARLHLGPRRPIARPTHHPRPAARHANPPPCAGAAPNPNPASGARHNAPHRPRTPGALSQRLPQAALTR